METEVRGRRDPDFPRRRVNPGFRAFVRIQLHKICHRTPWLPPFVLYVCADDTSADRTNIKRGRRSSQAARTLTKCRSISVDCTISRISHTAREVRVSAAPDFRLHPSSGFGSLHSCRLGYPIWLRTDPSKTPFYKPISAIQTGYTVQKFLRSFFQKATVSPVSPSPPSDKQKTKKQGEP